MLKPILLAGLLGLTALSAHAQEDATACDSLGMQTLQAQVDRETDQTMKTAATEQMQLAKVAMEAGQIDQCAVHIQEARRALGAKP